MTDRGWHPFLAAIEVAPGHWEMRDTAGVLYADLRFLQLGGELGYRAVQVRGQTRSLISYHRTLRGSIEAAHAAFIADPAPQGPVNGLR